MKKLIQQVRAFVNNRIPKFVFPLLTVVLFVAAVYLRFRGQIIVAQINGQPVFRWELVRELEKNYGSQVLSGLVTKKLVYQKADKENVTISDEDVSQELAKLEETAKAQGADLDQVLGAYGVDRAGLEDTLRYQLLVTKLADTKVEITDEEIDQYWVQNKESFAEGTTKEDMVDSIRNSLKRQKTDQKISQWLQELQNNANINQYLDF